MSQGWNRPSVNAAQNRAPKGPKNVKGLYTALAIGAVVLVAAIVVLSVRSRPEEETEEVVKKAPAKEITFETSKAPTNVAEKVVEERPKKKHPNFGRFPVEVDENGDRWIVRNGRRRKVIRGAQVGTSRQLWFNRAENIISALVTVKPGDTIVGFEIGPGFLQEFANSMLNKIEVTPEDTPEEAEEKMLVKEAKSNLAKALQDGEDIEQIVRDEYKNVMKLYNYKQELTKGLEDLRKQGASLQELEDYVTAANKLMEKYGIDYPVRLRPKEQMMLAHERGEEFSLKRKTQTATEEPQE